MLQTFSVLVDAFLEDGSADLFVLNENHEGLKEWTANNLDVVEVCFFSVRLLLVHELAYGQVQNSLHFTLFVELVEHKFHPLVEG